MSRHPLLPFLLLWTSLVAGESPQAPDALEKPCPFPFPGCETGSSSLGLSATSS